MPPLLNFIHPPEETLDYFPSVVPLRNYTKPSTDSHFVPVLVLLHLGILNPEISEIVVPPVLI